MTEPNASESRGSTPTDSTGPTDSTDSTADDPTDSAPDGSGPDDPTECLTAALVGTVGGAGTTRTAVELAATLARDGRAVAVVDAAYATQGLAEYLPGRIDPDCTALVTDRADDPLDAGLVDLPLPDDVPGRVACLPARAPFERLARAKAEGAARALADRIDDAATGFDAVLVDTPPVVANQAVAAVTSVDRVVAVTPGTGRGVDGLQRTRDRLADVGVDLDATVATAAGAGTVTPDTADSLAEAVPDADAVVPASAATPAEAPTAVDDAFASAMAAVASSAFDLDVDLDLDEERLVDEVGERVGSVLGR